MSKTMYRTDSYSFKITPVEVVRETDKMIVYLDTLTNKERKTSKQSSYDAYHETPEVAFEYIKNRLENKIVQIEQDLDYAKTRLQQFLNTYQS